MVISTLFKLEKENKFFNYRISTESGSTFTSENKMYVKS
jgi:hypothetical protein